LALFKGQPVEGAQGGGAMARARRAAALWLATSFSIERCSVSIIFIFFERRRAGLAGLATP